MAELGAGSLQTGDPAFNYQENELNERLKRLYPAVNEEETPLPRSWSPKDKYSYIGLSQNNLRVHYKGIQMWHTLNCQPIGLDNPGWFATLENRLSPRSSLSCLYPSLLLCYIEGTRNVQMGWHLAKHHVRIRLARVAWGISTAGGV